jgi:hypothetical protein
MKIIVFWNVKPHSVVESYNISEKLSTSIFRVEEKVGRELFTGLHESTNWEISPTNLPEACAVHFPLSFPPRKSVFYSSLFLQKIFFFLLSLMFGRIIVSHWTSRSSNFFSPFLYTCSRIPAYS